LNREGVEVFTFGAVDGEIPKKVLADRRCSMIIAWMVTWTSQIYVVVILPLAVFGS
jgi:hypothetical protein